MGNIVIIIQICEKEERELSKSDQRTIKSYERCSPLSLKRVINFVAQTKDKGLKMRFNGENPWEIKEYSNSDFAGDKNDRKV